MKSITILRHEEKVLRQMVSWIDLPEGMMFLSWQSPQGSGSFKESYYPTGTWQSFRIKVDLPTRTPLLFDPYQIPFRMWIRKAVWHVNGETRKAVFRSGQFGSVETVGSYQKLTGYGPGPAILDVPESGPLELEIEFMVQSTPTVIRDGLSRLQKLAAGRRRK